MGFLRKKSDRRPDGGEVLISGPAKLGGKPLPSSPPLPPAPPTPALGLRADVGPPPGGAAPLPLYARFASSSAQPTRLGGSETRTPLSSGFTSRLDRPLPLDPAAGSGEIERGVQPVMRTEKELPPPEPVEKETADKEMGLAMDFDTELKQGTMFDNWSAWQHFGAGASPVPTVPSLPATPDSGLVSLAKQNGKANEPSTGGVRMIGRDTTSSAADASPRPPPRSSSSPTQQRISTYATPANTTKALPNVRPSDMYAPPPPSSRFPGRSPSVERIANAPTPPRKSSTSRVPHPPSTNLDFDDANPNRLPPGAGAPSSPAMRPPSAFRKSTAMPNGEDTANSNSNLRGRSPSSSSIAKRSSLVGSPRQLPSPPQQEHRNASSPMNTATPPPLPPGAQLPQIPQHLHRHQPHPQPHPQQYPQIPQDRQPTKGILQKGRSASTSHTQVPPSGMMGSGMYPGIGPGIGSGAPGPVRANTTSRPHPPTAARDPRMTNGYAAGYGYANGHTKGFSEGHHPQSNGLGVQAQMGMRLMPGARNGVPLPLPPGAGAPMPTSRGQDPRTQMQVQARVQDPAQVFAPPPPSHRAGSHVQQMQMQQQQQQQSALQPKVRYQPKAKPQLQPLQQPSLHPQLQHLHPQHASSQTQEPSQARQPLQHQPPYTLFPPQPPIQRLSAVAPPDGPIPGASKRGPLIFNAQTEDLPPPSPLPLARRESLPPPPPDADESSTPVVPFEPHHDARPRKLSKGAGGGFGLGRKESASTLRTRKDSAPGRGDGARERVDSSESRVTERDVVTPMTPTASSILSNGGRRVLTKARPTTPGSPPVSARKVPADREKDEKRDKGELDLDEGLMLDDDPFARIDGVQVLHSAALESSTPGLDHEILELEHEREKARSREPGQGRSGSGSSGRELELERSDALPPEEPWRGWAHVPREPVEGEEEKAKEPEVFRGLKDFARDAGAVRLVLSQLSYSDWVSLHAVSKASRDAFCAERAVVECVLERFLGVVGYKQWEASTGGWGREPLMLGLQDLHNYMRGIALPMFQYAAYAQTYLQPRLLAPGEAPPDDVPPSTTLAHTARAYTRVVLRLRAQADAYTRQRAREAANQSQDREGGREKENGKTGPSRAGSRAPSPSSNHGHGYGPSSYGRARGRSATITSSDSAYHANASSTSLVAPAGNGGNSSAGFSSPLYKPQRAPLLRVFVPSPSGDWLSDESVVECESELEHAGVRSLLRPGDVVWDVAVGEDGNVGRLVWDGRYLVDLDYTFNRAGELPSYFHSLAFPPSYFHRVIRGNGNPIAYLDVSPWGPEIAANLQLIQDRARTETQHGASHNVVRWVHRSSFVLRPPQRPALPDPSNPNARQRLPVPGVEGAFVDPGWHGTLVLEAEGTNEGLADLQDRCGPRAFPPRAESVVERMRGEKAKGCKRVWRILRERSRPGEIWMRAVTDKEKLM